MGKLDDLLNEGFNIRQGDVFECLILKNITNSFLLVEILKRQIKIEAKLDDKEISNEEMLEEIKSLANIIAEKATEQKNQVISDFFLKNE